MASHESASQYSDEESHATKTAPRRRERGSQIGSRSARRDFVRVQGSEFVADGRPLRFVGVNIRGLVHYGDGRTLPHTTLEHVREQLVAAREMGARVVRLFLPSVHADSAETIARLHRVLAVVRAHAPEMYLLPALCNLYQDVELRVRGDDGFYARLDPNFGGNLLNADFFGGGYRTNYLPFVHAVVQAFRDEPLIFAWEIGNELKLNPVSDHLESDPNIATFLDFMLTMAREIRQLDPNHLITTGMISTHHAWLHTPALRHKLYGGPEFDFITVHCYNDERHNDDSDLAHTLDKPFIIEEAGYGRHYGSDRSAQTRADMAFWFDKGCRGYMPWGFMATAHDIGDGDRDAGLDRALHGDWDALFALYRSHAETLVRAVEDIVLPPRPVTPPAPPPAPAPPPPAPVALDTAFTVNQIVYTLDWLNIRRTPGYVGKLGDDIFGMVAPHQPLTVRGAATMRDALTWWPVRAWLDSGVRVDGWAAETNGTTRLLGGEQAGARSSRVGHAPGGAKQSRPQSAPVKPDADQPVSSPVLPPVPLPAPQLLYTTTYVNLRATPGYVGKSSDDLLGQIPLGAQIGAQPERVDADALMWRQVRAPLLDNTVAMGWAAEHDPEGTQLLAVDPPVAPSTNVGGVIGATFSPGATVALLAAGCLLPAASLSTKAAVTVTSLLPNSQLVIVGGPVLRGDLEWWQTEQRSADGQVMVGWAALASEEGMRLLATSEVAAQIHVEPPFVPDANGDLWPMTQGWGGNAQIYGKIPYDGVPLKGHNGLDFGTPMQTPLLACDAGTVLRVDYEHGGFGHFVLLQHAWGESLYAHLERVDVAHGATVVRGHPIGLSGNSGFSSGPHLHFGIRIVPYRRTDGWGGFVNPLPFMHVDAFVAGRAPLVVDQWTPLVGWQRP